MRRRALLTAAVAGLSSLAGCSSLLGRSERPTRERYDVPATATDTPTPAAPETVASDPGTARGVSPTPTVRPTDLDPAIELPNGRRIFGLSDVPDSPLEGLSLRAGFVADGGPPTLVTLFENETEDPITITTDRLPVLADPVGELLAPADEPRSGTTTTRTGENPEGLVLVPTPDNVLADATVWVVRRDEYWQLNGSPAEWLRERVELAPDRTLAAPFWVVGLPGSGGRPPGTYRFGSDRTELRIEVWDATSPGPTGESAFEGAPAPDPPGGSVAWYHRADPRTRAFLRPGRERVDLPATVEFEFVNHSTAELSCGGWRLLKRHDGEWFRIYPSLRGAGCIVVRPGQRVRRTFRLGHGSVTDELGSIDVGFLGGGQYAVTVGYGAETDRSGALVDVAADPVELVPESSVQADRRGDEVSVTSPRIQDARGEPVRVALERSDGRAETEYVVEQVMQPWLRAVRNTLPFLTDGVERVVLSTDEVPIFALGTFEYRDETYRLRTVDGQ